MQKDLINKSDIIQKLLDVLQINLKSIDMKKTLLFSVALVIGFGASAQVAKLQDVTPSGYDFSKYDDGAIFRIHVPAADQTAWAAPAVDYVDADMKADGQFTTLTRYGTVPSAGDENALRIHDFGGYLGKCLVFSTLYGPLQANVQGGYGPIESVKVVGGNSKFQIAFYADPATIQHGWSGAAIRVRLVYSVIHRGRHAKNDGWPDTKKNLFVGAYAFNNGNYVPADDAENGAAAAGYDASKYVRWENEGDCVANMPANQVVKAGDGTADLFDTAPYTNDVYINQLDRFHVLEFDTYAPAEEAPLIANFEFLNNHISVVIKEIKFFNIENAMDLLDADNEYAPIPGASYLSDRVESYRYYTENGMKEQGGETPDAPEGSKDNPYKICNAADFCSIHSKLVAATPVYFSLENDIDMSGVTDYQVPCGWDGSTYDRIIMFNGNNHVIKNLSVDNATYSYPSLFGVFTGEVRNLGVENISISGEAGNNLVNCGVIGGYAGHSSTGYTGDIIIDNVYATGSINVTGAGYAGGLVGTTGTDGLKITNSYVNIAIAAPGARVGGLIGRPNNNMSIENCYAAGSIDGAAYAGGLVGNSTKTPVISVINSAAWQSVIKADTADAVTATGDIQQTDVVAWNEMKVNDVSVTNGKTTAELQTMFKAMAAYNSEELNDIYPILAWQSGTGAVEGIIADENQDETPVYYNLQGVQVENPAQGLYIVKRGNKVSKEIIR